MSGFSRKVLDRAFVIELADVDLSLVLNIDPKVKSATWSHDNWRVQYPRLADAPNLDQEPTRGAISALTSINDVL